MPPHYGYAPLEDALANIANALRDLGNANANTPMGALEAHGMTIRDALEAHGDNLSAAIRDAGTKIAEALRLVAQALRPTV